MYMAFHVDEYDDSLVIDGFEQGIADSPHDGISNMRNVNIVSVPGEAAVNFKTQSVSPPALTGTVTSANAGADTITFNSLPTLESAMAITFSATTISGLAINTLYYVGVLSTTTANLYTDYGLTSLVNITGTGTGTFTTYTMSKPKYATTDISKNTYMIDSVGLAWSNIVTGPSGYWTYLGNTTLTNASGNGIVFFEVTDGTTLNTHHYLFIFRNGLIDYLKDPGSATPSWIYGWKPQDGTTGNTGTVLKTPAGVNNPHMAFVAPDSRVYFCDSNWIGRWYQTDPTVTFDPTTPSSYTFDQTALLPATDVAQCLTFLGTNLLIGGQLNVIYPWDRYDSNFTFPILLPEYNVTNMVTVNTNTYIFVGNRGRIYLTNGSNASLFKKVPDHISGTIEPYFAWGGACSVKNQLYFSCSVTTNDGTAVSQYGGVWAIDLETKALRLTNKLSYGTYAGYAPVLIPNFASNPAGAGLFIGWDSGASTYGMDKTISTPYVSSEATIDSDLIPIGTFNKQRNFGQVEYKLTRPLVTGESILVKTRLVFNTSDTGYLTSLTDSTVGDFSSSAASNLANVQWVQFQIVLNSTASTPSYVRLKEIRIKLD
jgi:hypothetical protein